jgi:hypothetical protein
MRRAFLVAFLLLPAAAAGQTPADDPARTRAEFQRSANNLKQIGLAFHNYESAYQYFPNNVYKDGKAQLSWRVLILPFIEEDVLFRQFKLDEPWDSPANKPLVVKMPKLYAPVRVKAKEGETFYRGFVTDRGPFGPKMGKGARIALFTDGLSNTGLVFEAGEPVVWTKPDDLELPAKGPLPKLGGLFGGVSQVVLADGSVRRIAANPDAAALRTLVDPADGISTDFDKLGGK